MFSLLDAGNKDKDKVRTSYKITNHKLCIDEIIITPQYTAAFDTALIERSSSNNMQMSFNTYNMFTNSV